jgi:hypothetical protein
VASVTVYVKANDSTPVINSAGSALANSPPLAATVGNQPVFFVGSNFAQYFTVELFYNGSQIATLTPSTVPAPTTTAFVIDLNFGGNAGVYSVQLVNGSGVRSAPFNFTVAPTSLPAPTLGGVNNDIGFLSGTSSLAASLTQHLSVLGTGLLPNLSVDLFYNGSPFSHLTGPQIQLARSGQGVGPISFVFNDNDKAGTFSVKVTNPDGQSAMAPFDVQLAPAPVITQVSPTSVTATTMTQTLVVYANLFLPSVAASLYHNGSLVSQLAPYDVTRFGTYSVLFADFNFNGIAGAYAIQVTNPDGQASPLFNFTVLP